MAKREATKKDEEAIDGLRVTQKNPRQAAKW